MALKRRRSTRFYTRINTVFKDEDGLNFACITDISHGGIFVECAKPLPANSLIRIVANQERRRPVVFEGLVVHTPIDGSRRGMGIQFTNLDLNRKSVRDDILISLMYQQYNRVQW